MSEKPFNKVLVILNPISGGLVKDKIHQQLDSLAEKYNLEQRIFKTTGNNDAKAIAVVLNDFKPDLVFAGGGDGTVNLAVNCLLKLKIPLGILPLGSANGLAREIDIPLDLEAAYENGIKGNPAPLDILVINEEHLSLHLSDLGFNANLVKRFEQDEKRGRFTYVRQFFNEYKASKSAKFTFHVNGETFTRRALMVVFANATRYGTGAIINPKGDLSDGKFEICIIKPYPWYAIFGITWAFFFGRLDKSPYVKMLSTKKVLVTTRKPQTMQVDGEVIGAFTKISARMLEDKIILMKPRD